MFCCQKGLFSPKIGRHFSPTLRIPLVDRRRPCVVVQPHLCLPNHVEQILILGVPLYLRLTSFLPYPGQRRYTIRINHPIQVILLDIRQAQHQRQELTYVVCPLHKRPAVEHFCPRVRYHAPELHHARVAAARSIDSQGGEYRFIGRRYLTHNA